MPGIPASAATALVHVSCRRGSWPPGARRGAGAALAAWRWPGRGTGRGCGTLAPFLLCALTVTQVSAATWSISSAVSSASVDHSSPPWRAAGGNRVSRTATRRGVTAGSSTSTP
jgi:hypothetical protein